MLDLLRLITLQDYNTRVVLLGAALLGLVSGIIGSFAVLRRRALVGDAVAHAALPGICAAYFVVGDRHFGALLLGALVFGVLAVVSISLIRRHTRIKEDAAIGVTLTSLFGLGVVMLRAIQNQPAGNRAGLDTFLFGKAAGMVRQDVYLISAVAVGALLCVGVLYKEFKLLCFDREFAGAIGRPVLALDLALMTLICVCTVIGLPAVGVVLMVALLVIPGAAARFWTDRLGVMLLLAGGFGAVSGLVGVAISALETRLSAGPLVALSAGAIFLISFFFAPRRGLVSDWVHHWRLRRKVVLQNLLRALYELRERAGTFDAACANDELMLKRVWSAPQLARTVRRAERAGWVRVDDGVALTPEGLREAAQVVRVHRLWELFLIEQAAIAPDHVDRDADLIEHVLPAELIERLEQKLREQGRLPEALPESPHEVGQSSAGAHA
jgi:manganese/zinc/iron transport system permease protein